MWKFLFDIKYVINPYNYNLILLDVEHVLMKTNDTASDDNDIIYKSVKKMNMSEIDMGNTYLSDAFNFELMREKMSHSIHDECQICNDDDNTEKPYESDIENTIVSLNDCYHHFHQGCIVQWFMTNHVCPICRTEYPRIKELGLNDGKVMPNMTILEFENIFIK